MSRTQKLCGVLLQNASLRTDADPVTVAALPLILNFDPDIAFTLLLCGNKAVHDVTAAFVYRELDVLIDFPGTLGHGVLGKQPRDASDKGRPCCPGYNAKPKLWAVFR